MLRIVQLLFAAAIFLTTLPALAVFSLQTGYPQREGGDSRPVALISVSTVTPGTAGAKPDPLSQANANAGFSRADCFDTEQKVRISLVDVPSEATDIEIWARRDDTSCADPVNRPGGSNVQCWKVAHWTREDIVNKIVTFRPIQVIEAIDKQISVEDGTEDSLDPATVCAKDSHMLPLAVHLQIMAFSSGTVVGWSSGGGSTGAIAAVWTAYDLAGPNPPSGVKAGAGNGLAVLEFEGETQPPADFNGYKVYCFPATAASTSTTTDGGALSTKADDGGLSDGGTVTDDAATSDASTDSGTSTTTDSGSSTPPAGCPTGYPFVPDELPTAEAEKYVCSSGNATAGGKITISKLKNGVAYAIAIGSRDRAGNSGTLSSIVCTTPKETDDFFTVYNRAGGTAGGGWCAMGSPRGATFGFAGIALGLALAARLARRGRR